MGKAMTSQKENNGKLDRIVMAVTQSRNLHDISGILRKGQLLLEKIDGLKAIYPSFSMVV